MHCAALALLLTTRMPVLWLCVGMCSSGIGVVFGDLNFSFVLEYQNSILYLLYVLSCQTWMSGRLQIVYSDLKDSTGLVIAAFKV
jgi:hypothetical protein